MKLNYKRTVLVGLAFFSICAFWQFYDNEIPKLLTNTFHLGETWTGVIMALDNVLALFLLPFFGTLSDRTETKIGKRMPFILGGTITASILLVLLIVVGNVPGRLGLFVVILLLLLVAMGTYRSPAVSLMPDVTPAPLRSKANAVINLMGALGGVYTLLMISKLLKTSDQGTDYLPLTLSIVLLMLLAVAVLFFTIPENRLRQEIQQSDSEKNINTEENMEEEETLVSVKEAKSLFAGMAADVRKSMIFLLLSVALWYTAYNAVTTAFSRYAQKVWGMENGGYAYCLLIANAGAILSYLPIGQLSSKIGRKKVILSGVVLMSISYLVAAILPGFSPVAYVFFALIGMGWAAINVNSYPMVVEMSDAGSVGKFTGTYYTFSMAAQVVTPILSGFLLEHVSYRTLFPYAFVFSTLAFITMLFVHHGDNRPD